jgi:dermatan 4-sulfotransferase 1
VNKTLSDWVIRKARDWRARRRKLSVWLMRDIGVAYLANPKVASSSIRNLIRERQGRHLYPELQLDHKSLKARVEKEVRISMTPAEVFQFREKAFLFSFVRNPLTRLYSCYRDKVVNAVAKHEESNLSPYGIRFGMTFDEFVRCVAEIPDEGSDQHFRSQHTFLAHEDRVLVHFVGKFERFESDWRRLTNDFGLSCPPRNRRVSGPPVEAKALPLTRSSAEAAMRRYEKDIELFGYHEETAELLKALPPS